MRLYLVQHGAALPKDVDPDRPLSEEGHHDIERIEEYLSTHKVELARILHSGKTRARETAELFRPLLIAEGEIEPRQGLAPNDSPDALLQDLQELDEDILVASHMPFVARAVSQALTGGPDLELLHFLPGSVAGIERGKDASWRLFLFMRPDFL